jgi:hypothetical protein
MTTSIIFPKNNLFKKDFFTHKKISVNKKRKIAKERAKAGLPNPDEPKNKTKQNQRP